MLVQYPSQAAKAAQYSSERGCGTNSGKSEWFDKIATYTRLDTHNKLQSADRVICCSNFGFRRAKWDCCRFLHIRRAVTVLLLSHFE